MNKSKYLYKTEKEFAIYEFAKLEQFRGKTLFPEKLAKANEILYQSA